MTALAGAGPSAGSAGAASARSSPAPAHLGGSPGGPARQATRPGVRSGASDDEMLGRRPVDATMALSFHGRSGVARVPLQSLPKDKADTTPSTPTRAATAVQSWPENTAPPAGRSGRPGWGARTSPRWRGKTSAGSNTACSRRWARWRWRQAAPPGPMCWARGPLCPPVQALAQLHRLSATISAATRSCRAAVNRRSS